MMTAAAPETAEAKAARLAKRERARALIRALLAKTTANGCTEQEAALAAAKAAGLMAQYDLTMADAQDVHDEIYGAMKRTYRNNNHEAIRFSAGSVAAFCDCRCFSSPQSVCFFGARHDAEIAHYLLDLIINAANAEWKAWLKSSGAGATAKNRRGFMLGFAARINQRLREIKAAQNATAATGNALVVVKARVVAERYAAYTKDMRFARSSSIRSGGNHDAYARGQAAGDRVNITTGIDASGRRAGALK